MARVILSEASVRVGVDVRGGERDAERAGEKAGRDYAKSADREARRNPVKLPIDPLTADFERQVRQAVAKISRTANANIPLTIKGEELRAKTAVVIGEIERTLSARIPTNPADALDYRRKLALLVRDASRTVRADVKLNVDVDRNRLSRLVASISGLLTKAGTAIGSVLGKVLAPISGVLGAVGGSLPGVIAGLAKAALLAPLAAGGVTVLGGAALAAFGAISAGVLGAPALLSTLLAPIAAITIGMDGIKRAAAPIADEIKLLKDVVNVAFEHTMRPVFEKLQAIFPTLTTGLNETAQAVSRFAMDLTTVVTSEAGIENLRVALGGVSTVIDHAREGVANLFSALLNVAGTRGLYEILGDTIGGVAARFGNMIERVRSSGDLAAALTQLRDLLFGVTDVLNIMIEGSIKFFAAAGPGLTSFFASLGEVLSRIDFQALGESFGGFMERLGQALEAIPPEKWTEIADAVGVLAEKFLAWVESGGITDLLTTLTQVAGLLSEIGTLIGGIVGAISGLNDILGSIQNFFYDNFTKPAMDAVQGLMDWLGISSPAQKLIDIGLAIIEGLLIGLASGPVAVFNKVRELATKALEALADAPTLLVDKGRQFVDGIRQGITDKLEDARVKAVEIKDKVKNALADAKEWLVQTGKDLVDGFISGITSKIESAASKAGEMARRAWEAARNFIEPGSPSRLFRRLGLTIGPGLAAGIAESTQTVLAAISRMLGSVANLLPAGIGESITRAVKSVAQQNSHAGMIQAEDGSWVSPSFYSSPPGGHRDLATILAESGARARERQQRELAEAVAAGMSGSRFVFDGPSVVRVVNDGNRQLARL